MARGDHIKVRRFRGIYFHHGVDMGDGTVVHLEGDPFHQKDVCVRRSTMDEFLIGGHSIVVEHPDNKREADLVCCAAEECLGRSGYNLFNNNCEHFASSCKTGSSESAQVTRLKRLLIHTGAAALTLTSSMLAWHVVSRSRQSKTA